MFGSNEIEKSTFMKELFDAQYFEGIVRQAEHEKINLSDFFLYEVAVGKDRSFLTNKTSKIYIHKGFIFEPAGYSLFRIFLANTNNATRIASEYTLSPSGYHRSDRNEKDWKKTVKRLGLVPIMSVEDFYYRDNMSDPRNPRDFRWDTSDKEIISYIEGYFAFMAERVDEAIYQNRVRARDKALEEKNEELKKVNDAVRSREHLWK